MAASRFEISPGETSSVLGGDEPLVSERIGELTSTVAVELILDRPVGTSTRVEGALKHLVRPNTTNALRHP